jgi:hypothetical protein
MKKLFVMGTILVVFLTHNLSSSETKRTVKKLETTSATLLMLSLNLAEKANQLYLIKDSLLSIVKEKIGNLSVHDQYIIDVISELKHIATIAYFESKLLGVVLIIREEFKVPFVNARIPELEEAINSTESSLQPVQIAYSGIQNQEALQQIDAAKEILKSLNQLYLNSITVLQNKNEKRTGNRDNATLK